MLGGMLDTHKHTHSTVLDMILSVMALPGTRTATVLVDG